MRVKQEVRAREPIDKWRVIGTQTVSIEQFAGVVCVVSNVLKPNRKPGLIEPLADKLRVTA
jgi:hypothetical protein